MGTGKTTLVKEGVSKILNRPFTFIPLGGATDSSFLEGHSYTYEGSVWGKIVDILTKCKYMNPVIYFDELDKLSDTPRGEEIAGILTHLTDVSQNDQFHDKYFSGIDFDLSRALFIFSYNDESKINPILKDRMYHIETKGYNNIEKTIIANQYLMPKIRTNVAFKDGDIIISNDVLEYINSNLTNEEKGVRNLKRCLEVIHNKLNLHRLLQPDSTLFNKELSKKIDLPYTVTIEDVKNFIIKKENDVPLNMYT
jgi:ATP-dependent Lon protease